MKVSIPVLLMCLVTLCGLSGCSRSEGSKATSSATSASTNVVAAAGERIVMIGASASAGFTESEPFGGPMTSQYALSRYVDAGLMIPHEPVNNLANTLFFMQPALEGRRQINEALKAKPTLVLAVDFLFWFAYGASSTDSERVNRFEQGLKLLEEIPCPLVLGDIPDASTTANDMLPREFIPSARILTAANQRLKAWAATRKHVVIVPLSGFMRSAIANQPFKIHGQIFASEKTSDLLQRDKLHPSTRGCAALALMTIDALQSTRPDILTNEVRWNLSEVWKIGAGVSPESK